MVLEVSETKLRLMLDAAEAYDEESPHYDGIFIDTGQRLRERSFASKQDVAVIAFWKAINLSTPWVRDFLNTDPFLIQDATRRAFRPGLQDRDRLAALAELPGFRCWGGPTGGAIPSTLLCCWNPVDFAVTDLLAREGLLKLVGFTGKNVLQYWEAVRSIRDAGRRLRPSVTARDIDKALFRLAGDRKRL